MRILKRGTGAGAWVYYSRHTHKKGFSDFAGDGPAAILEDKRFVLIWHVRGLGRSSLSDEPVTTPKDCKDTEAKVDWLPLTTLHPDWQKRIEQQCYCGKYP